MPYCWRRNEEPGVSRGGRALSAWTRGIAPMSGVDSRCSQIPEPPGLNVVLLHLEVQGLVVGAEVSRRVAVAAPASVEGPADRLPQADGFGRPQHEGEKKGRGAQHPHRQQD